MKKISAKLSTTGVYMLTAEHAPVLQILTNDPTFVAATHMQNCFSPDAARQFIDHQAEERAKGRAHVFVIKDREEIVGICGLHGIADGEAQDLRCWVGQQQAGQGYGTFAVSVVLQFAFRNLGLFRVGSTSQESDTATRELLLENGFQPLSGDPQLSVPDESPARFEITGARWLELKNGPILSSLHPGLQQILHAELAAGNELSESGSGWPEPGSVFVKLKHRFRTSPGAAPAGVVYTEPNSPHWWFADFSAGSPPHILAC